MESRRLPRPLPGRPADRASGPQRRRPAPAVCDLALSRLCDQPRRCHHLAGRRPPPPCRVRVGHPRPQGGRRAGASALGPVRRQQRLAAGPPWPTTCCAGPPGSVWAATASNWSPRRCAGHCSCCPAGSPAAGGSGRCTYPPAGRGPTHSPWRWLGCAASPTRPDRTPTPSLGSSATRRPLRPARHSVAPTTKPLNDHQSTPSAARSCGQPSLFASIRTPCPDRVRKTATAFADRWIQAQS